MALTSSFASALSGTIPVPAILDKFLKETQKERATPHQAPPRRASLGDSLHHATHAATGHTRGGTLFLGLGHYHLGDDDEAPDGGRVLQRAPRDHRRVDDPGTD